MQKTRVLSGVEPTGNLHIGNWLGAIKNWVDLQDSYETFFCVVDLHAITVPHDTNLLASNTLSTAALYISCGIDPSKSSIFVQSQVPQHSELCWILNCITPLNWMERMIQFKEKSVKQGKNVSIGLFNYPILMAADILLYSPKLVPVGEDQKQHLELARDIAQQRINTKYGNGEIIIEVPKPLIIKDGARIMSLMDGKQKMSKSDPNDMSRINLLDNSDTISKKIKKAKTDSEVGLTFNDDERPEASNLMNIYYLISNKEKEDLSNDLNTMGWGKFKPILIDKLVSVLDPIQNNYYELMKEKVYLQEILSEGRNNAQIIAQDTLNKLKNSLGFLS